MSGFLPLGIFCDFKTAIGEVVPIFTIYADHSFLSSFPSLFINCNEEARMWPSVGLHAFYCTSVPYMSRNTGFPFVKAEYAKSEGKARRCVRLSTILRI